MKKIYHLLFVVSFFVSVAINSFAQGTGSHLMMSLENCAQPTSNTIQFDLMVVSDGDSTLPVYSNSFQYGVNLDCCFLQTGATLSLSYISGTSDLVYNGQMFSFSAADSICHLRIVQSVYTGPQSHLQMNYQQQYRVGRFRIYSPLDFTNCCPNFSLQSVIAAQQTVCAALVYIGTSTITTSISTTGTGNLQRGLSVNCACTNGINENKPYLSALIFPNPTSGHLTISLPQSLLASIQIYNLIGDLKYSSDIVKENPVVDVSELANGMYFIQIKTKESAHQVKFIKY